MTPGIETMLHLLDWVEDGQGAKYHKEVLYHYPTTLAYGLKHRWLTVMDNGVVRATVQGGRLRQLRDWQL